MAKIFINYRRDDDPSAAALVRDGLAARFGKSALFMDVDNLLAGQKFDDELAKALSACDVLVSIIGAKWSGILNARIAEAQIDPDHRDYVREEIAAALKRSIVVIPVRVGRDGALASLPRPSELPDDIRALVAHQKHDVTHERFGRDVADLADAIIQVRKAQRGAGGGMRSSPAWIGALAAGILATGYLGAGLSGVPVPGWPGNGEPTRAPDPASVAGNTSSAADADAARIKADDAAFATAERRGALDGYGAYLGQFPTGRHVTLANERMAYLRKLESDFGKLSAAGTRAALEAFAGTNLAFKSRVSEVLAARDEATEAEKKRAAAANAEAEGKAAEEEARRAPKVGETFRDCPTCPEMVVVPAGSFMMGSPESEEGRIAGEGPQRKVTIAEPFAVGKFEVTFAEWDACVAGGGCAHKPADGGWGKGRRPVINVSWNHAKAYVAWLSKTTGQPYSLLTEAEWEYAARAGTTTPFSFGATISTDQANYDGNYTYGGGSKGAYRQKTIEVGSLKTPNAFGLHDMHGNVWEWVEDCYAASYKGAPSDGSKAQDTKDCSRVLRGGSWSLNPWGLRSAFRFGNSADDRLYSYGFRVARPVVSPRPL
ncbi:MAG: SUMF1/EgtB/PvdO family nonheme iron enzyme [Hyphomicrobium aestuarii]|nr:SUMF1/EgtB/PvdO family nonheme iron enzyme [Hyphomicrobium aestuarii]